MKIHFFNFIYARFFVAGLFGCIMILLSDCQPDKTNNTTSDTSIQQVRSNHVQFAKGFELEKKGDVQLLHLFGHYNDIIDTLSFVLAKKSTPIPEKYQDLQVVRVPAQRIALLHSSYVSFFDFCKAKELIKAISEVKYVYDQQIYQSVQDGSLKEIGYGETLDKEQLLSLNIDLIVTVGWPNSPDKSEHFLKEVGIPKIIISEWQESTLLGRAEWVKVIAALTGKDEEINNQFDQIAASYDSLRTLTKDIKTRPQIVCNLPYKGSWYVPGGNSYVSNLIEDAGGKYLWSDDEKTGGLQLDFESVYAKGINADFWINPGFTHELQEIVDKDPRLSEFKSYQNGQVFDSNKKLARGQANDYWESAIINPQVVLADMIHILHPDVLPNHQLVYYKKVE